MEDEGAANQTNCKVHFAGSDNDKQVLEALIDAKKTIKRRQTSENMCYNLIKDKGGSMIYTSYWGNIKKLVKAGIEPIQISRVPPKGMAFNGRAILSLAPTWDMLRMSWETYVEEYQKILSRNNPHEIVRELGDGDVALLCFEKNRDECHRSLVADWLNKNGYDVREYSDTQKKAEQRDEQLVLF